VVAPAVAVEVACKTARRSAPSSSQGAGAGVRTADFCGDSWRSVPWCARPRAEEAGETFLPCDMEERCTGTSAACPADGFAPATKVCRPSAGICDVEDTCTGTSATCPPDAVAPSSTLCRGLSGVCDVQEFCDGVHAECPPDGFAPPTTQCRLPWCNGDTAMKAGFCSGTSVDCPPEETEVCAPGACLGGTCTATRDMGGRAGGCGCTAALPFSSLVPWAFVALALTARRRHPTRCP
jgi:uncharacterized protein (TIGR03382 family)